MKKWSIVFVLTLSIVISLSPCTPQAASPTASITKEATTSSTTSGHSASAAARSKAAAIAVDKPQYGGVYKILVKGAATRFGYPPTIMGSDRDYCAPFFNRLIAIGDNNKYKPELALSWNTSADGKTITFKLRRGVKFHDGTDFNAQAVKSNYDNLIPPKGDIIIDITSIDVVDDYTVKFNLKAYNSILLYLLASNPSVYIYSPTALQKFVST
jgi:peptide/nickel transport system substrate-binding protein